MNIKSILLICILPALAAKADVITSFGNVGPLENGTNTFRTAVINDTITLAYTIDGAGAVSLDASTTTSNTTFVNLVNQFDRSGGTAGSTTSRALFNTTFSLKIVPVRLSSPNLSITTLNGGGLGIQGQNSNCVDGRTLTTSYPETLKFELTAPAGMTLKFKSWSWVSGSGGDVRFSDGTNLQDFANLAEFGSSPFGLVTSVLSLGNGGTLSFGETPNSSNGAGLGGFTFEILSPPLTANDAIVTFANSGTGFGSSTDPTTTPYITSSNNTAPITLAFSINANGVISLNASTTSTNATFINMVNEWDRSNVGSVENLSWLNTSFTLTGVGSGGGNLAITELGGGGIGIQGENSNRVDGLNYGTGGATSTPETLTWTLTGAPTGMSLSFKNWSYVEGNGGDIRVSNGTTDADFPNMSGATGKVSIPTNFLLSNGGSLTFKEIPGVGLTDGAGIAGFTFAAVAPSAPPAPDGFDNGAGNNLWSNATNWSPNAVPASPTDAIINGYDVILNSVASTNPDELLIANGSLTVTGSGALSLRAMTIGRDLTKTVRLVINGSGVSFRYNGSSGTDEFAVGSAATLETKVDSGGSKPLELGAAKLVLDIGSQWIVDGTNASGLPYRIGDRLVLANCGSFSGDTNAIRTRNFDLPSNRRLELVATSTSIYYEVKAQTAASGPNIIIINTDDQAADQHYGFDGRNCITPTLDSLVSTGLKFNLAFCSASVCGASRYSLLTSRWPSRNTSDTFISRYPLGTLGRFGVSDTELEHDGQNIGAWLQKVGYRTGFVGKSHVLDDELLATANWASKGLITYGQTDDPATNTTVNAAMQHNHRIVCQKMRALGYDYVDGFYHANLKELYNDKLNVHNEEWITSRALKFIDENRNEPFFLYMAPTINHGPVNDNLTTDLNANPRYTSAGYLPNEDYSFMPTRASIIAQVQAAGKDLITARETWIDYSVQAILDKLTAYGIRNNTLIIFTSDHGEKTLSSPTIWGKTSLYDLGLKVPLVMNWPNGIASPGRAYNELASHVDIGSTLLALTGASNLPTRALDGVSLVPVLNGSSAAVRSDVFSEMGYARSVRTKTRKYIAVRYTPSIYTQIASGYRWPEYNASTTTGGTVPRPYYINNSGLGGGVATTNPTYFDDDQLYNLTTDPGENTNIYGQEPATTYDLKKRLASYIGGIPNRPFRQFSDSSKEFSPTPSATPQPPQSLQGQFQGVNQVKLDWIDAANSELGYIIQKSVNGGPFQIIDEKPSGVTTSTVSVNAGVEDIVLQVSAYNSLGDAGALNPVDLLTPNSWRFRTFGTADPTLIAPASQWNADADGDGQINLWEYAFATNPLASSSVARSEGRITAQGQDSYLEYLVPRDARRNIQIVGAVSEDLITWLKGAPACVVAEDTPTHLLFRCASPVKDHPKQFIRAEIAQP
ncbi:MAG: sulfatase-like hydrolase/transferase [Akkermansiaceae bacterium]|nr:sulfatase-like hydrolase/transferase [Akkermansiaceae bacterium]